MDNSVILQVAGRTPGDTEQRMRSIERLNQLDTKVLKRLEDLSNNPNALSYFENDFKFLGVKAFLKI